MKYINTSLSNGTLSSNLPGIFESDDFLTESRKINIFASSIAILIGLVGNLLTIFVFGQKKARINSSHVYLLVLAINDSFFLVIHFFEDTIRTYLDIYKDQAPSCLLSLLNITDHHEATCKMINYLRNFLRFSSAYIVVAFTIQRLSIVYKPLSPRFKTKKSAWNTVKLISFISLLLNSWAPFLFEIQTKDSERYCDIIKMYKKLYFKLNIVYTSLIMSLPILIIVTCNSLIIFKTYRDDSNRKRMQKNRVKKIKEIKVPLRFDKGLHAAKFMTKPHYLPFNQLLNKQTRNSTNYSKKITLILLLISFSLVILNLPYLISWFVYFCNVAFGSLESNQEHFLFACLQISEIFYVLNYGIKFYIYCTTSSLFNNQLKSAGTIKIILFLLLDILNNLYLI